MTERVAVAKSEARMESWVQVGWISLTNAQAPAMSAVAHDVPTLPSRKSSESGETTVTVSESATRSGFVRPSDVGPEPVPRHMTPVFSTPPAVMTCSASPGAVMYACGHG